MLATLQNQGTKLAKGWTTWVQAATEMMDWSKLSVDMVEATNSIKEAAPSQLQQPKAASIAPKKAPRKSKQAAAKTAKTAKTVKPVVTPKPALTAKPATKTSRASSPRSAVVPKAKRRSP
jgi:hypothetical protein